MFKYHTLHFLGGIFPDVAISWSGIDIVIYIARHWGDRSLGRRLSQGGAGAAEGDVRASGGG